MNLETENRENGREEPNIEIIQELFSSIEAQHFQIKMAHCVLVIMNEKRPTTRHSIVKFRDTDCKIIKIITKYSNQKLIFH